MLCKKFYSIILVLLLLNSICVNANSHNKVGIWERFEINIDDSTWQGNPFDVVFEATFISPSGRNLTQIGFYAGGNKWKIYFMPDETGKWTYKTHAEDADLDEISGKFMCSKSGLDPQLEAFEKQWRLKGSIGDFPVIWSPTYPDGKHFGFRANTVSDPNVEEAIKFGDEVVGARLLAIGEIFIASVDWAEDWPQSAVPYVNGKEGDEFNFTFWDYLNDRMDAARDRNMGAYIMLYSDDAMNPNNYGITPQSKKEIRLFRYTIARLACYPHILWDTGIDISEYRNNEWINWYTSWFLEHDPWQHPVGSRSGGGSGGIMPEKGTYYSVGGASLPSRSDFLNYIAKSNVPIAHTDHWRPFISRGNWDLDKLRVAAWRCALTGAQALFPDFNQGEIQYDQVQLGAQEIGAASKFFKNKLKSDLLDLQPHDELITEGNNVILAANPNVEYIVYDEDGGDFSIDLSSTKRIFKSEWYNPKSGDIIPIRNIRGGKIQVFSTPTKETDWVLHIYANE